MLTTTDLCVHAVWWDRGTSHFVQLGHGGAPGSINDYYKPVWIPQLAGGVGEAFASSASVLVEPQETEAYFLSNSHRLVVFRKS